MFPCLNDLRNKNVHQSEIEKCPDFPESRQKVTASPDSVDKRCADPCEKADRGGPEWDATESVVPSQTGDHEPDEEQEQEMQLERVDNPGIVVRQVGDLFKVCEITDLRCDRIETRNIELIEQQYHSEEGI